MTATPGPGELPRSGSAARNERIVPSTTSPARSHSIRPLPEPFTSAAASSLGKASIFRPSPTMTSASNRITPRYSLTAPWRSPICTRTTGPSRTTPNRCSAIRATAGRITTAVASCCARENGTERGRTSRKRCARSRERRGAWCGAATCAGSAAISTAPRPTSAKRSAMTARTPRLTLCAAWSGRLGTTIREPSTISVRPCASTLATPPRSLAGARFACAKGNITGRSWTSLPQRAWSRTTKSIDNCANARNKHAPRRDRTELRCQ